MARPVAVLLALVFSGFAALVYQLIWTRLLGFVFGTSSEAIGTVLAVFFGGLALGNLLAARRVHRVARPFRVYALLELAIALFALASLPLLRNMDRIYAWVGTEHGPLAFAAIRVTAAAVVLLPPTIAMGATLPVVARGMIADDRVLGRWSALLYAANTLGAVGGAYLTGFWLIPALGVTHTVFAAAALNLAVAAGVGLLQRGTAPAAPAPAVPQEVSAERRLAFLCFFGLSGFVAIGYEMVWSKLFGIVMEGTLYGFSAVLSGYLLGIALGSALMGPFVDRIRDLPRAFGMLHVATAAAVAGTLGFLPWLPYAKELLLRLTGSQDPTQMLLLLALPVVLIPTALFGAAFPVLIRIYTPRAEGVARGMGAAVAVNTLGSIAASLLLGFLALPTLGMDATLFALLLLDLLVAIVVLVGFREEEGFRALPASGTALVVLLLVSLSFNGVQVERVLAGREVPEDLARYGRSVDRTLEDQVAVIEGRNVVVSVSETPWGRQLRANGLPEAGVLLQPPYVPHTVALLGLLPYLVAEGDARALVVGLGGGSTVDVLRRTDLERIDVVELEPVVVEAMDLLYEGRPDPLDDPRVHLTLGDGRNELLRRRYGEAPGFDLIASQPSHPWLLGAANLFTEEYFRLARANLRPGGVFALWVNGFRTDVESLLAIARSFETVFPGSVLVDVSEKHDRQALLLLGAQGPVELPLARMRRRMAQPRVAAVLEGLGFEAVEDLLARLEGPTAVFTEPAPGVGNTDDRAYVEVRLPRIPLHRRASLGELDRATPPDAPLLPPWTGRLDADRWVRAVVGFEEDAWHGAPARIRRLAGAHAEALGAPWPALLGPLADALEAGRPGPADRALRAAVARHAGAAEAWRLLGRYLALERRALPEAARAFARAHALSGAAEDAYAVARSLGDADPEAAWRWIEKIPPARREAWPRIAYFRALHVLAGAAPPEALEAAWEELLAFRDTPEGRGSPAVDETLSRLAARRGDPLVAKAFADAAFRQREARARVAAERARKALREGRPARAREHVRQARRLAPGHLAVIDLRIEVATATGDAEALAAALAARRRWAPDLDRAIAHENRLRRQLDLALLPPLDAAALARRARGVAGRGPAGAAQSADPSHPGAAPARPAPPSPDAAPGPRPRAAPPTP